MKKNRIALRLSLYFGIALLLLALLISSVFRWMFSRYSADLHRQELEARATKIAETMAGFSQTEVVSSGVGQSRGAGHVGVMGRGGGNGE